MRTKGGPLKPSDHKLLLELLRRMKRTTADQMAHLHTEGCQHRLSGCGASWNALRHHQGAFQPPPQLFSLSPHLLHPRQWHRRTTGQTSRGALIQGLNVQVGKIGFLDQAEGRHLRRQVQTSRRNMAEQGGGDSSGQRRQRPTALPGRPLDQELRISQGGVAPRSHGGASGGNPLMLRRSRGRQNEQQIQRLSVGGPGTQCRCIQNACTETSQLLTALRKHRGFRGDRGQRVHAATSGAPESAISGGERSSTPAHEGTGRK